MTDSRPFGPESLLPIAYCLLPPFVERCLLIHAEALAWRGGALIGCGRRIEVAEADLRALCRDLVRTGAGRLRLRESGEPGRADRGGAAPLEEIRVVAPAAEGQPAGAGLLERAGFDPTWYAETEARAAARPVARQRLALALAQLADDLHLPIVLFDPARVARTRPEVLARCLFDFWREIHRGRAGIAAAIPAEMDRAAGATGGAAGWQFTWAVDWRAECAFGEPGGGGPIYQVFRRQGIDLAPFARDFAAAAAEGRLDPAFRARHAAYFDSNSSRA